MTEFWGGLFMSYTSISSHTVTLLHTTHTHASPHQDTHSAFLSSCHPPAKNTGGKTPFDFRKQINSRVGDQLPDWERAESLWQRRCSSPERISWKLVLGNRTLIVYLMNPGETNTMPWQYVTAKKQSYSVTLLVCDLQRKHQITRHTSYWSHLRFVSQFDLSALHLHSISIQQEHSKVRENWWVSIILPSIDAFYRKPKHFQKRQRQTE